ncbi:hypothetical protein DPEC_G00298900 [Dallia pectoralis]|uniref:Uncharacterized protein n=1 Tax=Dallia pectoralis TaxID=75939 RepID=A0ACC2FG79_DALPE|nr:hypothetical protein DPEC_G00298900 [Dallia pectoralis]
MRFCCWLATATRLRRAISQGMFLITRHKSTLSSPAPVGGIGLHPQIFRKGDGWETGGGRAAAQPPPHTPSPAMGSLSERGPAVR